MSSQPGTLRYAIDPARSRFTVRVTAAGLLSVMGHNPVIAIREFSGEIIFNPNSLPDSALNMRVQPDSLAVQGDISEKDRQEIERVMKQDVLEVSRFPEIRFASTEVTGTQMNNMYAVKVAGNLALHGATKTQSVTAQVVPADGSIRAYGEFSLPQSDFGIKLVSVLGGTLKVKEELKFSFDMLGKQA